MEAFAIVVIVIAAVLLLIRVFGKSSSSKSSSSGGWESGGRNYKTFDDELECKNCHSKWPLKLLKETGRCPKCGNPIPFL